MVTFLTKFVQLGGRAVENKDYNSACNGTPDDLANNCYCICVLMEWPLKQNISIKFVGNQMPCEDIYPRQLWIFSTEGLHLYYISGMTLAL